MKEKLTLKTVSLILLGLVTSGGLIYEGWILLGKDNPDLDQDQAEISENSEDNSNDQNQNPDQTEDKAFDSTIEDLSNGWKLYTNKTLGFSIEFPKDWLIEESPLSNSTEFYVTLDDHPEMEERYPDLLGCYSYTGRYLALNVHRDGYRSEDGSKYITQDKNYNEKIYNETSSSYGPTDEEYKAPIEVTIGGRKAKKTFQIYEGKSFVYHVLKEDSSALYSIGTSYKETEECQEFDHMLRSFKIL